MSAERLAKHPWRALTEFLLRALAAFPLRALTALRLRALAALRLRALAALPLRALTALGAITALGSAPAVAGSCCSTAGGVIPVWVSPQEHVVVGVSEGLTTAVGRWDAAGRVTGSSLSESVSTTTLAAGWRLARPVQIFASLPLIATSRSTPGLASRGGGPGDLRLGVAWDPWHEKEASADPRRLPVPVFALGVRAPTGRDTFHAQDDLESDVTGLPGTAVTAEVRVERTVDDVPWYVSTVVETGLVPAARAHPDAPGARGVSVEPVVRVTAAVGRRLSPQATLMGTLSHGESVRQTSGRTWRTAWTTLGALALVGGAAKPRAWFGLTTDLPIPGLGAERPVSVGMVAGFAWGR
jgi:hypothetical protein